MSETQPSCSLHAILARDKRSAVILRRGPSKQVQLIRWWLKSDTFEEGQWFKGRFYERRCDLSPSGEKFAYFAQDFGRSPGSWTAISKPPFLTALAMWPKGDCWGGGALFDSEIKLRLNHRPGAESTIQEGYDLPKRITVGPLGEHSGWGEDDPINHIRLIRDGWIQAQQGFSKYTNAKAKIAYLFDPIEIYSKPHPGSHPVNLLQITRGLGVRNGPWYKMDHAILTRDWPGDAKTLELPDVERHALLYLSDCAWADWAPNGDLLYAVEGQLFRLKCPKDGFSKGTCESLPVLLADFSSSRFRPLPPTDDAQRW